MPNDNAEYLTVDTSNCRKLQTTQCNRIATYDDDVVGLGWCPLGRL